MGVEDFRVNTVLILLTQPLFGTSFTRALVVADSLDVMLIVCAARSR